MLLGQELHGAGLLWGQGVDEVAVRVSFSSDLAAAVRGAHYIQVDDFNKYIKQIGYVISFSHHIVYVPLQECIPEVLSMKKDLFEKVCGHG